MSDEQAFLNRILADLKDDLGRLIYADWLEECGDAESLAKSHYLRLECQWTKLPEKKRDTSPLRETLRELARSLDTSWLAVVSKVPIESCDLSFRFKCPKEWNSLQATVDPLMRSCDECSRMVHYCNSINDAQQLALNGECVAIALGVPRKPNDLPRIVVTAGMVDFSGRIRQDLEAVRGRLSRRK